jgi:hypothetical protein
VYSTNSCSPQISSHTCLDEAEFGIEMRWNQLPFDDGIEHFVFPCIHTIEGEVVTTQLIIEPRRSECSRIQSARVACIHQAK